MTYFQRVGTKPTLLVLSKKTVLKKFISLATKLRLEATITKFMKIRAQSAIKSYLLMTLSRSWKHSYICDILIVKAIYIASGFPIRLFMIWKIQCNAIQAHIENGHVQYMCYINSLKILETCTVSLGKLQYRNWMKWYF